MVSPVEVCAVPALVPDETASAHWAANGYGSCGSAPIFLGADSLPLASASTSCPALSVIVVAPATFPEPSKTLIRLVPLARTSTPNCVPRTSALTEWPPPTSRRRMTTKTPMQPRHPIPQPAQPLFFAGGIGVDPGTTGTVGGGWTAMVADSSSSAPGNRRPTGQGW